MIRAAAALALAGLWFAGCANVPPSRDVAAAARTARWPADRQIVVTVRNGSTAVPENAGSSGKHYGALGRYQPSAAALRDAEAIARRHGLQQLAAWPIEVLGVHCIVYGIDDARGLGAVLDEVAADRDVESAQPLRTFHMQSTPPPTGGPVYDDPYLKLQDSLAAMQVQEAHGLSRGRGVRIAVVDSGIDSSHPDLAHRIVFERDVTGMQAAGPARDRHGTAVAGIIAADAGNGVGIVGIAPEADVLALRACWQATGPPDSSASVCNTLTLAQALALAISERADIINLSLTGPDDPLLERLLRRALSMGKVVVAAIPEGPADGEGFPSTLSGVLAVASAEAPGSAERSPDALFAPGRNILTLRPGGRYDFENGSSMAAASVSGIVALLMSVRPRLSGAQIGKLLHEGANWSVQADARAGPVVNACRAVAALAGGGDCGELRNMHATRR